MQVGNITLQTAHLASAPSNLALLLLHPHSQEDAQQEEVVQQEAVQQEVVQEEATVQQKAAQHQVLEKPKKVADHDVALWLNNNLRVGQVCFVCIRLLLIPACPHLLQKPNSTPALGALCTMGNPKMW